MKNKQYQLAIFILTIAVLFGLNSCEKDTPDDNTIQVFGVEYKPNFFEKMEKLQVSMSI
jgi:hypothetical protein